MTYTVKFSDNTTHYVRASAGRYNVSVALAKHALYQTMGNLNLYERTGEETHLRNAEFYLSTFMGYAYQVMYFVPIPPELPTDSSVFWTALDKAQYDYGLEQYGKTRFDIPKEYDYFTLTPDLVWSASCYDFSKSITTSEKIGLHLCTSDLFQGMLESGLPIYMLVDNGERFVQWVYVPNLNRWKRVYTRNGWLSHNKSVKDLF